MKKLAGFVAAIALLVSSSAIAAERTVTLAVQNMYCAACPYTVRASLQAVPGVENVTVLLQQKTAVVTYDDARTNVNALTAATTNAGYSSSPKSQCYDCKVCHHLSALWHGKGRADANRCVPVFL